MTVKTIRYSEGYRFQLEDDFILSTGLVPVAPGGNRFVTMDADGTLFVSAGYAWDGASGPAINDSTILRGSAAHDAMYQLIRLGVLDPGARATADWILFDMVREDGLKRAEAMPWIARGPARALAKARASWVYAAVRAFGEIYMRTHNPSILTAP